MALDANTTGLIFTVLYGIARLVSHVVPGYTIVGKIAAWFLGNVATADPTKAAVTSANAQPTTIR